MRVRVRVASDLGEDNNYDIGFVTWPDDKPICGDPPTAAAVRCKLRDLQRLWLGSSEYDSLDSDGNFIEFLTRQGFECSPEEEMTFYLER